MASSLYPAAVKISYHSAYAPHVQWVPTKAWNAGAGLGSFDVWGGGTIDAEDMIDEFILNQAAFFPNTVSFDTAEIFTFSAPGSPAFPRGGKALTQVGTSALSGNTKAVQATWTIKCTDASIFKIVQLDMQNGNSFEKVTFPALAGVAADFYDILIADTNGWQSRAGGQPDLFLQVSFTLNEKLRKQYHTN